MVGEIEARERQAPGLGGFGYDGSFGGPVRPFGLGLIGRPVGWVGGRHLTGHRRIGGARCVADRLGRLSVSSKGELGRRGSADLGECRGGVGRRGCPRRQGGVGGGREGPLGVGGRVGPSKRVRHGGRAHHDRHLHGLDQSPGVGPVAIVRPAGGEDDLQVLQGSARAGERAQVRRERTERGGKRGARIARGREQVGSPRDRDRLGHGRASRHLDRHVQQQSAARAGLGVRGHVGAAAGHAQAQVLNAEVDQVGRVGAVGGAAAQRIDRGGGDVAAEGRDPLARDASQLGVSGGRDLAVRRPLDGGVRARGGHPQGEVKDELPVGDARGVIGGGRRRRRGRLRSRSRRGRWRRPSWGSSRTIR